VVLGLIDHPLLLRVMAALIALPIKLPFANISGNKAIGFQWKACSWATDYQYTTVEQRHVFLANAYDTAMGVVMDAKPLDPPLDKQAGDWPWDLQLRFCRLAKEQRDYHLRMTPGMT